jgi:hypothetical protein
MENYSMAAIKKRRHDKSLQFYLWNLFGNILQTHLLPVQFILKP